MAYYSFGRLLCSKCDHAMRMTTVTIDDLRHGGKIIEFCCTNCSDQIALPLNLESGKREEPDVAASAAS